MVNPFGRSNKVNPVETKPELEKYLIQQGEPDKREISYEEIVEYLLFDVHIGESRAYLASLDLTESERSKLQEARWAYSKKLSDLIKSQLSNVGESDVEHPSCC